MNAEFLTNVLPASCRQIVLSRIVPLCRQDAGCVFSAPTRIAAGSRDLSRRNVSTAQTRPENSKASTLRSVRARASREPSKPATEAALSLGSTATEDGSFAHQHPCGLKSALLAGMIAGLLTACSKTGEVKENEKPKAEESHVKRGALGGIIVTLDAETQKRIGLELEVPASAQWQPEVKGYGHVVDPAPLASLLAELASAHVAAETSQREFERLKTLAEQNNASVRALQAAEAMAKRDQLLVESLRTKLILGWGKAVLERDDPPAFVKSLANREQALVRVDLPAGESLNRPPSSARLISLSDSEHPVAAEFFDTAPAVDPQTQGQGFLFLVSGKPAGFSPNVAVTAYVNIPGESLNGVIVPSSAVIRYQGKAWVYVRTGDKEFTRREIPLDHPGANGWFVSSGVTDKDRVVASGTQTILSEELNQSGFMGSARD
jgi:hypothetical protein